MAYGSSQARSQIGAALPAYATAAATWDLTASMTYTTADGNAGSLIHWRRPGIEPESSWIWVRFITAEPWRELWGYHILKDFCWGHFPTTSLLTESWFCWDIKEVGLRKVDPYLGSVQWTLISLVHFLFADYGFSQCGGRLIHFSARGHNLKSANGFWVDFPKKERHEGESSHPLLPVFECSSLRTRCTELLLQQYLPWREATLSLWGQKNES